MNRFPKSVIGLVFLSSVIGVANLIGVCLFWGLVKQGEYLSNQSFDFSHFLTYQSHQNTILQLYLIIFSIGIAVLAFCGFSHIQKSAEEKAIKKAEEVSKEIAEKFIKEVAFNLDHPSYSEESDEK